VLENSPVLDVRLARNLPWLNTEESDSSWLNTIDERECIVSVSCIDDHSSSQVLEVADVLGSFCSELCLSKDREKDCSEDCDDRDNDQEFN
jgi:hypothetical protein